MFKIGGIILCFAYIIGLLSTGISSHPVHEFSREHWTGFLIIITIVTILVTVFLPRFWLFAPPRVLLFSSGLVVLFAVVYFHFRLPHQGINDVSNQLNKFNSNFSPVVEVTGKIITNPRLTRNDKIKFIVQAETIKLSSETTENVTGKLYVTVPLLESIGLYPSQIVTLKGKLYQPSVNLNPAGFNFKNYLLNQGIFAGFTAEEVKVIQGGNAFNYQLWQLRHRIITTHIRHLKVPIGNLISAMVLGRREVDLPYEIQDLFTRVGLVHILAVSGFHVSLWLGLILFLTQNFSANNRLIVGFFSLLIYPIFTGFYPSILRATLMGFAVLIGIVKEQKVNSFGSLLLAATILLLINPLFIWNLGFQLSFLATLGLIVTLPAIVNRLDWLPPNLSNLVAVPIASSIWVFPLLIYTFNTICTYSILVNIILIPLVIIISLGAMITALIGLISPPSGSAIAFLLYYPTLSLIKIVEWFDNLPGSSLMTGKISLAGLIFCYLIFLVILIIPWCQKRWQLVSLFLLIVLIIPIFIQKINLNQVTILATKNQPIIVIQNQGKTTTLINKLNPDIIQYNLLPFLAYQGINKIDYLIVFNPEENSQNNSNLLSIVENIPSRNISLKFNSNQNHNQNLNLDETFFFNNNHLKLISQKPAIVEVTVFNQKWILLWGNKSSLDQIKLNNINADILLWKGFDFNDNWLKSMNGKVAISFQSDLSPTMKRQLEKHEIEFYSTKNDGAIQYIPKKGFQSYLQEYDIIAP